METLEPTHKILDSLALQSWQQRIFSSAPSLLSLSPTPKKSLLEPFLAYAGMQKLMMQWSLPCHLLHWLCIQSEWQSSITNLIKKELLIATVTRWSLMGMEHIAAKGMLVASQHVPGLGVGIWKSREAHQASKIISVQLPNKMLANQYALSFCYNDWSQLTWQPIPY